MCQKKAALISCLEYSQLGDLLCLKQKEKTDTFDSSTNYVYCIPFKNLTNIRLLIHQFPYHSSPVPIWLQSSKCPIRRFTNDIGKIHNALKIKSEIFTELNSNVSILMRTTCKANHISGLGPSISYFSGPTLGSIFVTKGGHITFRTSNLAP